jgi:predicted RNA binding protein YcfA (HicA-like mRNA interferase family)
MPGPETSRAKIVARLERDGWQARAGGRHDVFKHPRRPGRIIVPRHRALSPGVARAIAKEAGWTQ